METLYLIKEGVDCSLLELLSHCRLLLKKNIQNESVEKKENNQEYIIILVITRKEQA